MASCSSFNTCKKRSNFCLASPSFLLPQGCFPNWSNALKQWQCWSCYWIFVEESLNEMPFSVSKESIWLFRISDFKVTSWNKNEGVFLGLLPNSRILLLYFIKRADSSDIIQGRTSVHGLEEEVCLLFAFVPAFSSPPSTASLPQLENGDAPLPQPDTYPSSNLSLPAQLIRSSFPLLEMRLGMFQEE